MGRFFLCAVLHRRRLFSCLLDTFFSLSCLLIPNRIRACETRPPLTKDDDPLFLLFFVLSGSVRVRERVRHRFYRGWAKRRWGRTGERKPFEKRIQSQPSRRRRRDRERQRHQWYAAVLCFRARRFFLTSPGVRRELESDSNALSVFSISLSRTCFILFLSFIFSRRQTIANGRPAWRATDLRRRCLAAGWARAHQ